MPEERIKTVRGSRPAVIWLAGIVSIYGAVGLVWRVAVLHKPHAGLTSVRWWAVLALYCFVAVGLFRRWKSSRWITVVLLVVWTIYAYWVAYNTPYKPRGEWNAADWLVLTIGIFIAVSMFPVVASLITLQPKVSHYFNPSSKTEEMPKGPPEISN